MARLALALALVALAAPLSGCVINKPGFVQEGDHSESPLAEDGRRGIEAKGFDVVWRDPRTGETRPFSWPVTAEGYENGVYTVATEHLTLRYRVDEPLPVRLRHDEDLSRRNSFNFTYDEPSAQTGRAVTSVVEVDRDSFLDAKTFDPVTGRVSGDFVLSFTGTCAESDDPCPAPGAPLIVHLEGKFPPRTH